MYLIDLLLHAFIPSLLAWMLIEVFVNNAYRLSRPVYLCAHYAFVILVFGGVFALTFLLVPFGSVFDMTIAALAVLVMIEWIVFGLLYTQQRWFLNFSDWIFPMFLAATTIYAVGLLVQHERTFVDVLMR